MKRQTYVRSCVHNRYFYLPAVTSRGLFIFTEPVTGEISKGVNFQKESGQECSLTLGSLPLEQFRFSEPDRFFQIWLHFSSTVQPTSGSLATVLHRHDVKYFVRLNRLRYCVRQV